LPEDSEHHYNVLAGSGASASAHAIRRRVYIALSLYLFATLLCVIDTRISIGLIVLVQLNCAIAPRIGFLRRL